MTCLCHIWPRHESRAKPSRIKKLQQTGHSMSFWWIKNPPFHQMILNHHHYYLPALNMVQVQENHLMTKRNFLHENCSIFPEQYQNKYYFKFIAGCRKLVGKPAQATVCDAIPASPTIGHLNDYYNHTVAFRRLLYDSNSYF